MAVTPSICAIDVNNLAANSLNLPWHALADLLNDRSDAAGLGCEFPARDQRLSLLEALGDRRVAASPEQLAAGVATQRELQGLIDQLSAFERMSRCPILGITGILNSGKSSLLATYLGPAGRARVLRGLSNLAGTHRFVLWLPNRWQQENDLLQPLTAFLTQLFGQPAERLSDDIDTATRQYNGRMLSGNQTDPMSVPLLAFDSGLDDLQIGLLDCPDIQTGYSASREGPDADVKHRQRWLAAIGRLCSAFVVMTKLNSLHDQVLLDILTTLRDSMPGVPRILAINRVKSRYAPETVANEAKQVVDRFGINSVYVAYDFRSSLADTRIPPRPNGLLSEADGAAQPIFFQVSGTDIPAHTAATQYLFHLGQRLDAGALAQESSRSLETLLKAQSLKAADWHHQNPQLRRQQTADAWQVIAQACFDFMVERDASGEAVGLRLQTSPAIVGQLSDSLRRTAPMWMKLSLSIDRTARQLQQAIADKTGRLKILQNTSQYVADFVKRFRGGEVAKVVTPETISRSIRQLDRHDAFAEFDEQRLRHDCEAALARFAAEEQPELDPQALDQWSRSIWDQMPMSTKLRRGVQPLALVTGPLLAALLVPFDGGGTSILVFASTKELLAAAGLAALLPSVVGGGETMRIVQEETPWRQLSDLFAILCDSLGIQRPPANQLPSCGSPARRLQASRTAVRIDPADDHMNIWIPAEGALAKLHKAIERAG